MEKKMSFEEAVNRLEEIIKIIEDPQTSIEQSIDLYKEAGKLIELCTKTIDKAELQVKVILNDEKTEDEN